MISSFFCSETRRTINFGKTFGFCCCSHLPPPSTMSIQENQLNTHKKPKILDKRTERIEDGVAAVWKKSEQSFRNHHRPRKREVPSIRTIFIIHGWFYKFFIRTNKHKNMFLFLFIHKKEKKLSQIFCGIFRLWWNEISLLCPFLVIFQ